jgi:U3 small nucleolar RNA-associated protein 7
MSLITCTVASLHRRNLLFGGRKGHVASYDCHRMQVGCELQLKEDVHDVQYLHNETLFAVAQSRYVYVYDNKGVEIHCMKRHERPYKLDFLPYHFLLTTVGHSGWIKWHDVSTGDFVAGYATGHGPCKVLTHNPTNAVSHTGHANGVVALWSPASGKALASMFCHKAPVTGVAVDREGKYMATTGLDGYLKVLRRAVCWSDAQPTRTCVLRRYANFCPT